MNPDRLKCLEEIEQNHFWFLGRRMLVDRLVRRTVRDKRLPVLDLGCGTGRMLERLTQKGYMVWGVDLFSTGLSEARRNALRSRFSWGNGCHLPFGAETFGAVVMLDVMEHVDDQLLLAEVWRCLRPGGILLLSVPALPWLWSYRDEAAGHLRRYTPARLLDVLARARFRVRDLRFYQCFLLPLVIMSRFVGRRVHRIRDAEDRVPKGLNAILALMTRVEAVVGTAVRLPLGTSLMAVCVKP